MGFTEREAWAYLVRVAGGASPAVSAAVARYGPIGTAERVISGDIATPSGTPVPWPDSGLRDMALMRRLDGRLVVRGDSEWPAIDAGRDGPLALWAVGSSPLAEALAPDAVSIIGTRAASPYGTRVAARFTRDVLNDGKTVIAEAEPGIGTAVIYRALAIRPSRLVVVLRSGFGVAFASHNARLLCAVVAGGGTVISELAPDVASSLRTKALRARLMSLTSAGTIVVEAGIHSGSATMHAELSSALGKFVGAVPGPVTSPVSAGTNAMLRRNAHVIASGADIKALLERSHARGRQQAPCDAIARATTVRHRTLRRVN